MKIRCPICKTSYQVNLPNLTAKGVAVECAKCHNKFVVKPEAEVPPQPISPEPVSPVQTESKKVEISTPAVPEPTQETDDTLNDFLDQLIQQENPKEQAPTQKATVAASEPENLDNLFDNFGGGDFIPGMENPIADTTVKSEAKPVATAQDHNLDNFLDDLIGSDLVPDMGLPDTTAQPSVKSETKPATTAQDHNLDNFLDDLIGSDLVPDMGVPDTTAQPPVQSEAKPTAQGQNLDNFLDDLIGTDLVPDMGTHMDTAATKTAEEPVDDATMDAIWEQAVAEGAKEEQTPAVGKEEDFLAQAFADQQNLNQMVEGADSNTQTTATAVLEQNTPAKEPTEEDLWAQAFADQEKTEKKQEAAPTATAEPSEEDLWAQAFADQEKTEKQQEAAPTATAEPSEEDLWAQAFADQEKTEKKQEAAPTATAEPSEEDLWAQAFADQDNVEKKQGGEPATAGEESDEDLWAKAFADQDNVEKGQGAEGGAVETPVEEEAEIEEAKKELDHDVEEIKVPEESYDADEDEDEIADEAPTKKKLLGFIPVPTTKTGKLVFTGTLVALLLAGGGGYFAYKTLRPPELAESPVAQQETKGEATSETETKGEKTPAEGKSVETKPAEEKATATKDTVADEKKSTAAEDKKAAPEEKKADVQPAEAEKSGETKDKDIEIVTGNALPEKNSVAIGTIMPVAFNATDIRVLSFVLEVQLSDEETANAVRNALPAYEKLTMATVEDFLNKKFYNDILYVREKLQKKLQVSFDKALKKGKVKKAKFKDFVIQ